MRGLLATVLCLAGAATAQETMYVIDGNITPFLVTLDKANGDFKDITLISGAEALFGGLAVDDAGDLYSIDGFNDGNDDRLFRIDRETAQGTVVGDTGFNWNFRNVTVHPVTDVLYGSRDNQLFTLDRDTGMATLVNPIAGPTLDQMTSLAIDADGNAYGTDIGDTGLFQIDLNTGAATHLGDLGVGGGNWFRDLAFDENGTLYGVRSQGGVYTIDIDEATLALQYGGNYTGVVFYSEGGGCAADCNGDGELNVLDFVCFQLEWQAQSPAGDCDGNGEYNVLDFVCYQGVFQKGCP